MEETPTPPLSLVTSAPEPEATVEKVGAVVMSIIPPEELRGASLDQIKLALCDQMEEILSDIATQIYVHFRTR